MRVRNPEADSAFAAMPAATPVFVGSSVVLELHPPFSPGTAIERGRERSIYNNVISEYPITAQLFEGI
jgi:hypothetical protein